MSTSVCGTGMSVLSPHSKPPVLVQEDLGREGSYSSHPIALFSFETLSPEPLGLLHTQFITSAQETLQEFPYTLRSSPAVTSANRSSPCGPGGLPSHLPAALCSNLCCISNPTGMFPPPDFEVLESKDHGLFK